MSPLDVTVPDFYQARIVSRIALLVASDGGPASSGVTECGYCPKTPKNRALRSPILTFS